MTVDSVKGQYSLGVKKLQSLEKSLSLPSVLHPTFCIFRCVVLKASPVISGHYLLGYSLYLVRAVIFSVF